MSQIPTRTLVIGVTSLAAFVALGGSTAWSVGPDSTNPRYLDRHDYRPAPGDITTELRDAREERLSFSPLVDQIVADFSSTDFDQRLRDLTGENSVLVGGASYTFHTRHSYSDGGQKSWQYA
ncbi:MAG: hypothetical protein R3E97_22920, partial [Candidatus Eisenbacteria bacterium]